MFIIGCHLSASAGYTHMINEAISIGANTFQFFTRNPRGGKAKDIDENDVTQFLKIAKETHFGTILAHAPYTLNLCSANEGTREFALNTLIDDLNRMQYTPGNLYNLHPGSHVGQGEELGIELIADAINKALKEEYSTTVLLETMAGKGSEVGKTFEEISAIIDRIDLSHKVGVCLDTCHISDAGYDIIGNPDGVLDEFDRIIGLDRLKAIHLNDSMNDFGSHKDRHAKIGEGKIGAEALINVINNPRLSSVPFLLETPNDIEGYQREIAFLKEHYHQD